MDGSISLLKEKNLLLEGFLKESMRSYKTLFDCNQDAIFALDLNGYFVSVNPACEKMTGYSSTELAKKTFQSIVPVAALERVFNQFHQAIGGQVRNYDSKIIHKNGQTIELNITNAPISVNDEIVGIYGVAKDITEIKRKSQKNRENAEIHSLLINNSLDVIARTDLEGRYLYISPASLPILGYPPEELIGVSCYDLVHKDDLEKALIINSSAVNSQEMGLGAYRMRKKDGSFIWIEALCKPIFDQETNIAKETISIARDVTQRKITEDELKNREESYSHLVEHSPDAVIIAKQGEILYINDTGVKLFGASDKKELIGKVIVEFLHKECLEADTSQIEQIIAGNTIPFMEQKFNGVDGRVFEAEIKGIPTIYQKVPAMHLIIRDIEERKQTQKLLLESETLTVAGQLAAGIAHEVRNPLTAIKGFLQLMGDKLEEEKTYFDIINSEINRIELILSELLTLAKPQDMKFVVKELKVIIEQVKTLIDPQAIIGNIQIHTNYDSDNLALRCDENQLKQVFINFLKNSIEAMTDGGLIKIDVKKHGSDKVKLLFTDQGCGIPENLLKRLGEPFLTTKESGTGLGLMISKQIVENHDGTFHIWSDSKGTIIEVILPIA